jgi:hypothetical protein
VSGPGDRVDNGYDLGERLRRLAVFADQVPPHARVQVSLELDRVATLLGRVVAEVDDDAER